MKHEIIQTDNYLLVVDDKYEAISYEIPPTKYVLAHLPLNNAPTLEGVPLLPPLEDEVEKLVKEHWEDDKELNNPSSFKAGYNKAKEKYKYTEEDLRTLIGKIRSALPKHNYNHYSIDYDEIIKSLQQPKYPVAFECEEIIVCTNCGQKDCDRLGCREHEDIKIIETTTNSQGQTVLVGTYKYE
jgi:hypothetical protein